MCQWEDGLQRAGMWASAPTPDSGVSSRLQSSSLPSSPTPSLTGSYLDACRSLLPSVSADGFPARILASDMAFRPNHSQSLPISVPLLVKVAFFSASSCRLKAGWQDGNWRWTPKHMKIERQRRQNAPTPWSCMTLVQERGGEKERSRCERGDTPREEWRERPSQPIGAVFAGEEKGKKEGVAVAGALLEGFNGTLLVLVCWVGVLSFAITLFFYFIFSSSLSLPALSHLFSRWGRPVTCSLFPLLSPSHRGTSRTSAKGQVCTNHHWRCKLALFCDDVAKSHPC